MGTRDVYKEKLRSGNLFHEPTMSAGLGAARCPRCLSPVHPVPEKGEWTVTSAIHDATAVAGSGIGGMLGAVHAFNKGLPLVQKHVKGPMWLNLLIGIPPVLLFAGASAAFGGFAVPNFAQLSVTSYYAASSASHYAIAQATSYIEDSYSAHALCRKSD